MKQRIPTYITVKWLTEHQACPGAIRWFRQTFPSGRAGITEGNLMKIRKHAWLYWITAELAPMFLTQYVGSDKKLCAALAAKVRRAQARRKRKKQG